MRRSMLGFGVLLASLGLEPIAHAQDPSSQVHTDADRVPTYAFWAGMRAGVFSTYGAVYSDGSMVTTPFQDVATAGPSIEFDVGARFARRFAGYAFLDQAFLGRGSSVAWTMPHGGQSAPSTQALGIGMRWETNPDGLGLVLDLGIAYRWFTVRWEDETTVHMNGPGEVRLGLGANWRVARDFTLAPMLMACSGAFANRTLDGQKLGESANSYTALALTLGGHFDFR